MQSAGEMKWTGITHLWLSDYNCEKLIFLSKFYMVGIYSYTAYMNILPRGPFYY